MTPFLKYMLLYIGIIAPFLSSGWTASMCQCTCVTTGESIPAEIILPRVLQKADAVFLAEVASGRVVEDGLLGGRLEYTFSVTEYWKGIDSTHIRVRTGLGGGDCGFGFGQSYLVYASLGREGTDYEGQLFTDICTRTGSIRDRETRSELTILRRIK